MIYGYLTITKTVVGAGLHLWRRRVKPEGQFFIHTKIEFYIVEKTVFCVKI